MTGVDESWREEGPRVLRAEGKAVLAVADGLDRALFERAIELLFASTPPVVVTGMGKSGHIAAKIAATMASTGTPAFYLHPAEAMHGDLGMVPHGSTILVFSQSGATEEVLNLLPYLRSHTAHILAITGQPQSPLAQAADVVLLSRIDEEACPLNLAPTTSTTVQLALGDALAMALMRKRGFGSDDFAIRHPLGALGKRLLMRVGDLMKKGDALPMASDAITLQEAVDILNKGRLGAVALVDGAGRLTGYFTDGDFRRLWCAKHTVADNIAIRDVMIKNPKRVSMDTLGVKAVDLMEQYKITSLPAVDDDEKVVGMIHLHQLVEAGITR